MQRHVEASGNMWQLHKASAVGNQQIRTPTSTTHTFNSMDLNSSQSSLAQTSTPPDFPASTSLGTPCGKAEWRRAATGELGAVDAPGPERVKLIQVEMKHHQNVVFLKRINLNHLHIIEITNIYKQYFANILRYYNEDKWYSDTGEDLNFNRTIWITDGSMDNNPPEGHKKWPHLCGVDRWSMTFTSRRMVRLWYLTVPPYVSTSKTIWKEGEFIILITSCKDTQDLIIMLPCLSSERMCRNMPKDTDTSTNKLLTN